MINYKFNRKPRKLFKHSYLGFDMKKTTIYNYIIRTHLIDGRGRIMVKLLPMHSAFY